MAAKKIEKGATTDASKNITNQLSDLRLENRALKKLFHSQQAQINEQQTTIALMWNKIGM